MFQPLATDLEKAAQKTKNKSRFQKDASNSLIDTGEKIFHDLFDGEHYTCGTCKKNETDT